MKVLSAEFVTSAAAGTLEGAPRDGVPQIALAGRSNVGKSSLINALCRRTIARTSAAPGKTRLANVYRVTAEGGGGPGRWDVYLVDLPGYGYARGGAESAAELKAIAEAYFAGRGSRSGARGSRLEKRLRPERGAGLPRRGLADARMDRSRAEAEGPASIEKSEPSVETIRPPIAALLLVDARHPALETDAAAAAWLASLGIEYHVVATKIDKLSRRERARNLKTLAETYGTAVLPVSAASGEGLDHLWTTIATLARNP